MESLKKLDIKKFDSRGLVIFIVCAIFVIFEYYIGIIKPLNYFLSKPIHLYLAIILCFLYKPLAKTKYGKPWMWTIDVLLILGTLSVLFYSFINYERFVYRIPSVDPIYIIDIIVALFTLFSLLEAVRRVVGLSIFTFIVVFLGYATFGQYIPGIFRYSGTTLAQFSEMLILSPDGIMGVPLAVSLEQIFFFLIFGAFFNASGGGQLLVDIGMSLGRKTTGGPAKAAVLASSLMGMISGSAVANVCSTGVITIPLMKRNGYTAEEAGAIETVASTGGQLMPPIMGVGAFIMAEMLGVPYTKVATSAIIPAFVYYLVAFLVVHFITKKKIHKKTAGFKQLDYKVEPILRRLFLLIPLVCLVYLIFSGWSLARSATISTLAVIVVNLIDKKRRLKIRQFVSTVKDGVIQAMQIAIPTAACGIMIGIVIRSGVANKISALILQTGTEVLFIGLLVGAIGCLLMGMAMPTSAAYLVSAVMFVPTIIKLGVAPLPAHLFIFYFGVIAQITPPVAQAAFAAAGISGGKIWNTGWKAFFMGSTAFLVPFAFVYKPELLLLGTAWQTIISTLILIAGSFCLACAVSGYLFRPIERWWQRILIAIVAIMVITPETTSTIIGLGVEALFVLYFFLTRRRDMNENIKEKLAT